MKNKRLHFIDGYKGLLCFMIMFCHFWNTYRLITGESPLSHRILDTFTNLPLGGYFLVASFWLYAFLVISGYLLSFAGIKSTTDLLTKSVCRFLRLFIPIFGACVIIFVIYKAVGFHNVETADYFKNAWLQSFYTKDFVWKDIFKQSYIAMFKGNCDFNPPFWVIRDMLVSSVLIYICKLTDHIFEKKTHLLPILFTLCALLMDRQVMTACLIGFLIGYYAEGLGKLTARFKNFFVVFIAIYGIFLWLKAGKVYPAVFDKTTEYTLIHCFLLIALNRFSLPQRFFSSKPFLLIGKISFGVYAFHWPVTCSVGSLVLMKCIDLQWHPIYTMAASFLVSLLFTVIISVVYYFTVEKFGNLTVRGARKLGSKLPQ